ncbi:MAG: tryptophan 7-halogenase [Gammaproteobacteria bacterium]|nr:tryptophan 7-halogenase [Gammaproteobacteria bacterium]
MKAEIECIRDFIILHCHVTRRADSAYWNACREMEIPETLAHKLRLFESSGRIFRDNNELFSEPSRTAVMVGQGIVPNTYHPFVDNLSDAELQDLLVGVRVGIARLVARQRCIAPTWICIAQPPAVTRHRPQALRRRGQERSRPAA